MANPFVSVAVNDKGLAALRKKVANLAGEGLFVTAGVQEGSSRNGDQLSNAEVAAINEYGTSTIPARPFVRPTFQENHDAYLSLLSRYAEKNFKWDSVTTQDVTKALSVVGMKMAADMKKKIRDGIAPPNSKKTIARKGSSKPLIDSGQLINSIKHHVGGGDK